MNIIRENKQVGKSKSPQIEKRIEKQTNKKSKIPRNLFQPKRGTNVESLYFFLFGFFFLLDIFLITPPPKFNQNNIMKYWRAIVGKS